MNKPTVLAILDAFKKTVAPWFTRDVETAEKNRTFTACQVKFFCELEPLIKAHHAEELSRKIALAELRRAIEEGLSEFDHDREIEMNLEKSKDAFKTMVERWLARLES